MILTKDKYFYKTILDISLPIAFQNLLTFSVNLADTIMLGRLGEISLSSSSIANHLGFFFLVLIFGVGGGANVIASQYYGKKDYDSIHQVISIMYRVCILLSILFLCISLTLPKYFMYLYTDDISVINQGVVYLKIIGFSYIFHGLSSCTITVLRSIKTVKISLLVYSVSLVCNISLNYALIFGNFNFPALGIQGAAIATVVSRIIEFIILCAYIFCFEKKLKLKIDNLFRLNKDMMYKYIKVSTPIIMNEFFWSIGNTLISIIIGRMGRSVVAANSINNVLFQFSSLFIFGLASASSVLIGNTIGKSDYKKVKEYSNTLLLLSVATGILSSIIIFISKDYIVNLYNVSSDTKTIAIDIMKATSLMSFFKSISSIILMGILRGSGDNKFVFKIEMIFLWLTSIPLGYISAFVLEMPVFMIFIFLKFDDIFKSFVGFIRVKNGKFIKDFTK